MPYRKWMRVLDALNWIAENAAPDLAYRWFCGSKMCGTCAVRMNGREVLACWEAVEPEMTIEPLRNLPVIRDLVVDRAPFESKVEALEPWIERPAPYAGLSRAPDAQADEKCLEGARLHRLHVLLLGLPGDRSRRPHRFRRPRTAGAARADRARSAQRPGQGRALAGAHGHFQLRLLLQMRGGLPGQHPDRQPGHRAAEGKGGRAACPGWRSTRSALRAIVAARGRVDPGALVLRVRGLRALRRLAAHRPRFSCAARSIRIKRCSGDKTPAARSRARRLLGRGGRAMRFAYYPGCSAR